MNTTLIEVQGLKKYFPIKKGFFSSKEVGAVKAVDDVDFQIHRGEIVGLVGESGCGKTTTGRLILNVIKPTDGKILYRGADGGAVDVARLNRKELWNLRRRTQMVFQDPYSSLNPRMTVQELVQEPLICYKLGTPAEQKQKVAEMLRVVGLDPRLMTRYPHAFSGGQRQRIGIARALILNPELIIADEPVSALDVSIQAQILNLLHDLQGQFNLTILFISHDLAVINHLCSRTIVMYMGKIVEVAPTPKLFDNPLHPYVEILLAAVPRPEPGFRFSEIVQKGEVSDALSGVSSESTGCSFAPRCKYAQRVCLEKTPELRSIEKGNSSHLVSCHFAETLDLRGVTAELRGQTL